MSITKIFRKAYNIKLLDCKDIMEYTRYHQLAFIKIQSLITKNLSMSKRTIEMTLQESLFPQYLEKKTI